VAVNDAGAVGAEVGDGGSTARAWENTPMEKTAINSFV
jgi:hypothetical protein